MTRRNKVFRLFTIAVSTLFALSLCCCGPSREYFRLKEQGKYPETEDFPDTTWECQEVDMTLDMLDSGEDYRVGEYVFDNMAYRVVAEIEYSSLDFYFYSSTDVAESEYLSEDGSPFISCEPVECGVVTTEYIYEDNTIVCSFVNVDSEIWTYNGEKLTFKKTGKIAKKPESRWYCEEIDMYLESFSDAKKYYKGKISIEGKECYIHAFEIGNDNYYAFSIENGVINNLKERTSGPLVCMFLEFKDGKIIGKITDDHLLDENLFAYWTYQGTILTFNPV